MRNPERVKSPSSIALIGYRGCGKTTVGRRLAEALNWEFLDADDLLEAAAGKSIAAIFADDGERSFRDREATVLEGVLNDSERVIATGGGVVVRPENRLLLRDSAYVVWLTASAETLWERLQSDPTTADRRPALTAGGFDEVRSLLAQREPWYRETATIGFNVEGRSPADVAADILASWFDWAARRPTLTPNS